MKTELIPICLMLPCETSLKVSFNPNVATAMAERSQPPGWHELVDVDVVDVVRWISEFKLARRTAKDHEDLT